MCKLSDDKSSILSCTTYINYIWSPSVFLEPPLLFAGLSIYIWIAIGGGVLLLLIIAIAIYCCCRKKKQKKKKAEWVWTFICKICYMITSGLCKKKEHKGSQVQLIWEDSSRPNFKRLDHRALGTLDF